MQFFIYWKKNFADLNLIASDKLPVEHKKEPHVFRSKVNRLKMALVHRMNLNFNSLLGTYYCRCMINIKRLKTEHTMKVKPQAANDTNLTTFTTFEQMITFRQRQARKTVLVRVDSVDAAGEAAKLCTSYGRIHNTFIYRTKANKIFLLAEYETQDDLENLKCAIQNRSTAGNVNVITSLLQFKRQSDSTVKHKEFVKIKCYPYTTFTMPLYNKLLENLKQEKNETQQMILLYNALKITDLNVRLRFFTADQLTLYLSKLFTNISVVPFGSSVNGFGQLGCDLDLLCRIDSNKGQLNRDWRKLMFLSRRLQLIEREEQQQFLEAISGIIESCIPGILNLRKVLEARVPIIRFSNLNTNMQCDLSCTNMIALYMSELLYIYAELDWRVKPLVCTIRTWARNNDLTKEIPGHWITNFSLTLLIVFYLQTRNILPSLNSIKKITEKNENNNHQQPFVWFTMWKNSIQQNNTENLYELLHGFFKYYSLFNFQTQAICIREGIVKPKKNISPLYIYNPFDLTLNVSKNLTSIELSRLIENFQNALLLLESSQENTIIKLIKLKPHTNISGSILTAQLLNEGIRGNENNSDTYDLKCINQGMLTNKKDTNVLKNRKESIIK